MVDLEKAKSYVNREEMTVVSVRIRKSHLEALKKSGVRLTDFVRQAFKETFDEGKK